MTAHTPEELRVAVCEALGWKECQPCKRNGYKTWRLPDDTGCQGHLPPLTLDIMALAEKLLKRSPLLWGQYCNTLALMCGGAREDDGGLFVSHKEAIDANAEQRARAFVAVKQG